MADKAHIAGLPFFAAGAAAAAPRFEAGAPFWRALDQLDPDDPLAGQLDALLAGAVAPRVWLLLHEPGEPQLSAWAAMVLARALMARGQNILVLDTDEAGSALTIWAEREETEGWIDVARFGASMLSAGAPLPFAGARGLLLGVGSFTPTDVTEDEIISLLSRLRHQADDLLLVAAVGPDALPWARRAERRLFCWDPAMRGEGQLGPVTGPFASSGVPLTGLLGFGAVTGIAAGVGMTADAAGAVAKAGDEPAADPAADPGADPGGIGAGDIAGDFPEDDDADFDDVGDEIDADAVMAADERSGSPPEPAPGLAPVLELGAELEPPRGTPRLFWLAAGAFAVALVAIGWYWSSHVRVPPGGYFEPVTTAETIPAATGDSLAAGEAATTPAAASAADTPRTVAEAGGLMSAGDSVAAAPSAGIPGAGAAAKAGAAAAPFDPAVYAAPVGQAGWALHVYSLADSASAAAQTAQLERAGFRTAVRIVEIKDKGGRWWRLYLGSFPTRTAAKAAMPALLERLGEKWAEPARIQVSTP